MTTTTKHKHRAQRTAMRPFTGPADVMTPNQAAHGAVCLVAICACGAIRRVNANGDHIESGRWQSASEEV